MTNKELNLQYIKMSVDFTEKLHDIGVVIPSKRVADAYGDVLVQFAKDMIMLGRRDAVEAMKKSASDAKESEGK